MKNCIYCKDKNIVKNWILKNWWQRFRCRLCSKTFTIWWIRWTYDNNFREKIIDNYCHKHISAREIVAKYKISSATLISWAKDHKRYCKNCI